MSIYVICRYNQARSIIGAAAIRKFYPDVHVISGGVEAVEEIPLPTSVLGVASEWGLAVVEKSSTPFASLVADIKPGDLIIAADAYVAAKIKEHQPQGKIVDFASIVKSPVLSAVDPSAMPMEKLRLELSKSVAASLLAAGAFNLENNSQPNMQINTIIPNSDESLSQMRHIVLEKAAHEGYLILDASLRVSEVREWKLLGANVTTFDQLLTIASSSTPLTQSQHVFAAAHEFTDAPNALMSLPWFNFVRSLAENRKLLIITPSATTLLRLPDLALSAWHGPYRSL